MKTRKSLGRSLHSQGAKKQMPRVTKDATRVPICAVVLGAWWTFVDPILFVFFAGEAWGNGKF